MYNNTSEIFDIIRLVDIVYVPLEILAIIFICTGNILVIIVIAKYKVGIHISILI